MTVCNGSLFTIETISGVGGGRGGGGGGGGGGTQTRYS